MPAAIKVGIVSLGCPKNLVDSEYICEQFGPAYAFVNDPAEAEILRSMRGRHGLTQIDEAEYRALEKQAPRLR